MKVYASDLKPGDMIAVDHGHVKVCEVSNTSYGIVTIYTDVRGSGEPLAVKCDHEFDVSARHGP
jgi:hypothetical protein